MFAPRTRNPSGSGKDVKLSDRLSRLVSAFNTQMLPADQTLDEQDASSVIELDFSSYHRQLAESEKSLLTETMLLEVASSSSDDLDDYMLAGNEHNKFTIDDCSSISSLPGDYKTPREFEKMPPSCTHFDDISDAMIEGDTIVEIEIDSSDLDPRDISELQEKKLERPVPRSTPDIPNFFKARLQRTMASQWMENIRLQNNTRPDHL